MKKNEEGILNLKGNFGNKNPFEDLPKTCRDTTTTTTASSILNTFRFIT